MYYTLDREHRTQVIWDIFSRRYPRWSKILPKIIGVDGGTNRRIVDGENEHGQGNVPYVNSDFYQLILVSVLVRINAAQQRCIWIAQLLRLLKRLNLGIVTILDIAMMKMVNGGTRQVVRSSIIAVVLLSWNVSIATANIWLAYFTVGGADFVLRVVV